MILSPYEFFHQCFERAKLAQLPQYESMALVTSTPDGRPSARMVLLKGVVDGGFRFFTNYESRKAQELIANPRAQLLFYWAAFGRQIRIEGTVQKLSESDSDAYFMTRPRGSRLGAIASLQSRHLGSYEELRSKFEEIEKKYEGQEVTRPANWGGFELIPSRFEFWEDRNDRLHERIAYESDGEGSWKVSRLWP